MLPKPIPTRTESNLRTTVRAIAVCNAALASDAAHGMRAVTATLWAGYRREREAERAWREQLLANIRAGEGEPAEHDLVGDEFGRPGWLSATVLAAVVAVAAIASVDGWGLLADAWASAWALLRPALAQLAGA